MKLHSLSTPSHGTIRVLIGSRYTGRPAAHADTTTGTYWEAQPKIDGHMLKLQACLLSAPRPAARPLGARVAADLARLRGARLDPATGVMRGAA